MPGPSTWGSLNEELTRTSPPCVRESRRASSATASSELAEREQAAYGFEDICDVVVYSHEIGYLKPDARAYHAVCEQLESRARSSAFFSTM